MLTSACTVRVTPQIATGQKSFNLPYCNITSPKDNTHFSKPTAIHVTVDADARDKYDQSVTVEFLLCKGIPPTEKQIQSVTVTRPPYTADFAKVPAGEYSIFAKASKPSLANNGWSRVDVTVRDSTMKAGKAQNTVSEKPK